MVERSNKPEANEPDDPKHKDPLTDQGPRYEKTHAYSSEPAFSETISKAQTGSSGQHTHGTGSLPEHFGRYRIVRLLGKGGMGAVYLAADPQLDRQVAIKVPFLDRDDDGTAVDRFYREARAVAALDHANICPVYEVDQVDGVHYMAMAFIDGKPLSKFVTPNKPLSPRAAVVLVRKLALALQQAHDAGVIHRDLKPSNIMIRKSRNRSEPIIMDFGLARREGVEDEPLTHSGQLIGTPIYMSPEQVAGDIETMGPGCDIYSLGVILYQLMTGQLPFQGKDLLAILSQIATSQPQPPSAYRSDLDDQLDAICLKAMSKQVVERFSSMDEFARVLAEYLKHGRVDLDGTESQALAELDASIHQSQVARAKTSRATMPVSPGRRVSLRFGLITLSLLSLLGLGIYLSGVILKVQTPAGTLIVQVNEPGAQIEVLDQNKELVMRRNSGKEELRLTLNPGKHVLKVSKEGFEFETRELILEEGGHETIKVTLVPHPEVLSDNELAQTRQNYALQMADYRKSYGIATLDKPRSLASFTLEAWFEVRKIPADAPQVLLQLRGKDGNHLSVRLRNDGRLEVMNQRAGRFDSIQSDRSIAAMYPVYFAVIQDQQRVQLYVSRQKQRQTMPSAPIELGGWTIGCNLVLNQPQDVYTGLIDELRLSTIAREGRDLQPRFEFENDDHTLALYHFNEGEGTQAFDSSGNNLHAAIHHCIWLTPDGRSVPSDSAFPTYALQFDGQSSYVAVPSLRYRGNHPITLEAFVKVGADWHMTSSSVMGWNSGVQVKVSNNLTNKRETYAGPMIVAWPKGGKFGDKVDANVHAVQRGEQVHLAGVWDGKQIRIYVNGKRGEPQPLASMNDLDALDGASSANFCIGSNIGQRPDSAEPSSIGLFHGTIDEVRISNIARYTKDFTPSRRFQPDRFTMALYHFDEGHGDVAHDSSGNNHHGKIIAANWVNADGSPIAAAKASPFDQLRRQDIDPYKLQVAGLGNADTASEEIVAILGESRFCHWRSVLQVVFGPDGKNLASVSHDGTVKLWDAETGKEIHTFLHSDPDTMYLSATAFHPDGNILASVGSDQLVRLWDVITGQEILRLAGHEAGVRSVAFRPDGKLLASADEIGNLRVWDPATGDEIQSITAHQDVVHSLAFSADGKMLASSSGDKMIKVWDTGTWELMRTLSGHEGRVRCVVFSWDGKVLVSGSDDKTIKIWDPNTGITMRTLSGKEIPWQVNSVAVSPDRQLLASCTQATTVTLWDLGAGTLVGTLSGHRAPVGCVTFSPDGRALASSGGFGAIKLWNLDARTEQAVSVENGPAFSVTISPDGETIAAGCYDTTIKLWNAAGSEVNRTMAHENKVTCIDISYDGRWIASGSTDRTIKLWDIGTHQSVQTFTGHGQPISAVAFRADGQMLASASEDGTVKLWDTTEGEEFRTLSGHADYVEVVGFSRDGRTLVSGSRDRTIKLWDALTGKEIRTLRGHEWPVRCVAISPDGFMMASSGADRTILLWDLSTGDVVRTLPSKHAGTVLSLAFRGDGRRLASSAGDGSVRLWDVLTGKLLRTFQLGPPGGIVYNLKFTSDGRHLVTANGNGTVYVLRLESLLSSAPSN